MRRPSDELREAPAFVQAELSYIKPTTERPRYYYYEPAPGKTFESPAAEVRSVRIHNMRPLGWR